MHRDVHGLFVEQFQEQEIVSVEPFQEIALEPGGAVDGTRR